MFIQELIDVLDKDVSELEELIDVLTISKNQFDNFGKINVLDLVRIAKMVNLDSQQTDEDPYYLLHYMMKINYHSSAHVGLAINVRNKEIKFMNIKLRSTDIERKIDKIFNDLVYKIYPHAIASKKFGL